LNNIAENLNKIE